jgi:hypothetical protein
MKSSKQTAPRRFRLLMVTLRISTNSPAVDGHYTRLLCDWLSSMEDDEVWNAAHIEPSCQCRITLCINLHDNRFPAMSAAVRATSGAAIRQGPHQAAQKSTSTGTCAFWTTAVNSSGSTSNGSSNGGREFLQTPQRPVSERCPPGTRF